MVQYENTCGRFAFTEKMLWPFLFRWGAMSTVTCLYFVYLIVKYPCWILTLTLMFLKHLVNKKPTFLILSINNCYQLCFINKFNPNQNNFILSTTDSTCVKCGKRQNIFEMSIMFNEQSQGVYLLVVVQVLSNYM